MRNLDTDMCLYVEVQLELILWNKLKYLLVSSIWISDSIEFNIFQERNFESRKIIIALFRLFVMSDHSRILPDKRARAAVRLPTTRRFPFLIEHRTTTGPQLCPLWAIISASISRFDNGKPFAEWYDNFTPIWSPPDPRFGPLSIVSASSFLRLQSCARRSLGRIATSISEFRILGRWCCTKSLPSFCPFPRASQR